ncbi:hypothetical protein [Streptomyces sp. NPDC046985]|uniref:hypothetical protein n=1 Tax=Streptomyces sp. NPDC046985 TaxID=3155377 RepID=UPI0034018B8A
MDRKGRQRQVLPGLTGRDARSLLGIYLNDHLAGATVGSERSRQLAAACRGSDLGAASAGLAGAIAEDRRTLVAIMRRLDQPIRRYKVIAGLLGERVGRLKANGSLVRRSPLSTLLELELLQIGVRGKQCLWEVLRSLADRERRLDAAELDELLERAQAQLRTVEELRERQAARTFGGL